MKVGIPKEIKNSENRIAITPAGVYELKNAGHEVYIETNAGSGSGFLDADYVAAGAEILTTPQAIFEVCELILKVKEPLEQEYDLIKTHHTIFTYFHFASSEKLTKAMLASGAVCLAYETVEKADRSLPLLIPMSEVAGRMSIQEGAKYLEKSMGGRGILLGGVPGVKAANVLILGGGIVGTQAARMAAGLGANVTIMDVSLNRLRQLSEILPANVTTLYSNSYNVLEQAKQADLIVGAVLIPGAKAPLLIPRGMLCLMKPGAVVIDVAVDQGGCIETCKPTTHDNPTYVVDGIVHYCVANMPGAVPFTSTTALTNATMPYVLQVANKGWKQACDDNLELAKGLNMAFGKIFYKAVAEAWGM
ncbi:MAG: alanine dehydrogenase [Bacteroidota bacterium]|jgi:alanine dehydrogenase